MVEINSVLLMEFAEIMSVIESAHALPEVFKSEVIELVKEYIDIDMCTDESSRSTRKRRESQEESATDYVPDIKISPSVLKKLRRYKNPGSVSPKEFRRVYKLRKNTMEELIAAGIVKSVDGMRVELDEEML